MIAMIGTVCVGASSLAAQQKNDSLLATFAGIEDDSTRLDSMIKVAFELGFSDPVLGLWLAEKSEAEAKSQRRSRMQVRAQLVRGSDYYNLRILDKALSHFLEALNLADSIGYAKGQANAWNNIANVQADQGHNLEALESYRNSRRTNLRLGSKHNAMIALSNIATIYIALGEYDRGIAVCDSAFKEIDDPNDDRSYGSIYMTLCTAYDTLGNLPKAIQNIDLAIEKFEKIGDDYDLLKGLLSKAEVLNKQGMVDQALQAVNRALQMGLELGGLEEAVGCYNLLSKIAKAKGDAVTALEWMEKSKALSDSIRTEESETALANYQALYEVNQKDAEIDLLNKDKEIQEAKLSNVWYLFGLVSVVLLAMISVVVILVRSNKARRRINLELQGKNEQILKQHEQISVQNTALSDQNEQLNNLNHEMSGLLHVVAHDLKAPLNQVTGLLSVVEDEGNLNPTQEKMLAMAKKVTNNAGNLVKDLVELGSAEQQGAQLQKVPVPLKSLVAEVAAAFSADAARKSITIETTLPEEETICQTEPNQLRRVLENLVSNALKFSPQGKSVRISLTQDAGFHRISIQDQGPGISAADQKNLYRKFHKLSARPTGGESSSGLGLAIVKTLVEQLGGEIALTSEVGVGSTFVVSLPI